MNTKPEIEQANEIEWFGVVGSYLNYLSEEVTFGLKSQG